MYPKRGKLLCKKVQKNWEKYLPFRIHFLSPLVGARTGKILVKNGENLLTFLGINCVWTWFLREWVLGKERVVVWHSSRNVLSQTHGRARVAAKLPRPRCYICVETSSGGTIKPEVFSARVCSRTPDGQDALHKTLPSAYAPVAGCDCGPTRRFWTTWPGGLLGWACGRIQEKGKTSIFRIWT